MPPKTTHTACYHVLHMSWRGDGAHLKACRIFPNQGWNPCHLQWKPTVLTAGPPGSPEPLLPYAILFLHQTPVFLTNINTAQRKSPPGGDFPTPHASILMQIKATNVARPFFMIILPISEAVAKQALASAVSGRINSYSISRRS